MLKHNPKLKKAHNKAKWRKTYKNVPDIYSLDMRYKGSKDYVKAFGGYIENSSKDLSPKEREDIDNLVKMI